jgi:hypothetical protein
MRYSFDIIKSQWGLFFSCIFLLLFPMFLWIMFHVDAVKPYLPNFLVESHLAPLVLLILLSSILIFNKRKIFWKEYQLSIDKEAEPKLIINGEEHLLSDIEYFEFKPGSALTTGLSRMILFIKFRNEKEQAIIPCKSSDKAANYDAFVKEFKEVIEKYEIGKKEKTISKNARRLLIAAMVFVFLLFIGMLITYGQSAIKMLGGVAVFYAVSLPYLLRKTK